MGSNVIEQNVPVENAEITGDVDLVGSREIVKGDRGFSAYEVAVSNGFEGSEEEWLESLEGKDGDNGISPHIGENNNWFVGDLDTGVSAKGEVSEDEVKQMVSDALKLIRFISAIKMNGAEVEPDEEGIVDLGALIHSDGTGGDPPSAHLRVKAKGTPYTVPYIRPNGTIGPALLPLASEAGQGVITAAQFSKLEGIAEGATKVTKPADIGAEASGTAETLLGGHNTSDTAHNDIRVLLEELRSSVLKFLDVDDASKDQLSELLALIDANADSIESITNGKVNKTDIVNDLLTNLSDRPLAASQGVVLKSLYDALSTKVDGIEIPTKLSDLSGDSTHRTVTDAEKQAWNNKQPAGNYALKSEIPTNYAKSDHTHGEFSQLSEEIDNQQTVLKAYIDEQLGVIENGTY